MVEICNENGLVTSYLQGKLDRLPEPYAGDLQKQWNAWLRKRYGSTADLRRAWKARSEPLGRSVVTNGDFAHGMAGWRLERHQGARATARTARDENGDPTLRIDVTRLGKAGWHVQLIQPGFEVKAGAMYTLTFSAKADRRCRIAINVGQAGPPWGMLGLRRNVEVGRAWQSSSATFLATKDEPNARVNISNLGARTGTYWIARVALRPGGTVGIDPECRVEDARIPTVTRHAGAGVPQAAADWVRFLAEVETAYWLTMYGFVKNELGYPGIVFGTILGTSLPSIQARLDAIDSHAYWQHPRFPGRPWDPNNWFVANKSMVNEPPGCVGRIAGEHVAGKPHLVTEYNHPAPNTYGSEGPLLLAAYAAYHDLDGIFMFAYGSDWDARRISGFFDIAQHPTKMANMPVAAALFRRSDVATGQRVHTVPIDRQRELDAVLHKRRGWGPVRLDDMGVPWQATLVGRTAMQIGGTRTPTPLADGLAETKVFTSDTGQLVWDVSRPGKGVVTVDTPRTKAVIGFVDGRSFELGGLTITPGTTVQDWCTVAVTLLEGESFSRSGRAIVVVTGYAENTGMCWKNNQKNTVGRDWGRAPSLVEVVPVQLTLPVRAGRVEAFALDERGQRAGAVTVADRQGQAAIDLNRTRRTLWYELVIK